MGAQFHRLDHQIKKHLITARNICSFIFGARGPRCNYRSSKKTLAMVVASGCYVSSITQRTALLIRNEFGGCFQQVMFSGLFKASPKPTLEFGGWFQQVMFSGLFKASPKPTLEFGGWFQQVMFSGLFKASPKPTLEFGGWFQQVMFSGLFKASPKPTLEFGGWFQQVMFSGLFKASPKPTLEFEYTLFGMHASTSGVFEALEGQPQTNPRI